MPPALGPSNDDGPLFADYLKSDFPCDDLFFNDKIDPGDQSPLLESYSPDNRGSSSPGSNLSSSSKASFDEVDSDISLAITKVTSMKDEPHTDVSMQQRQKRSVSTAPAHISDSGFLAEADTKKRCTSPVTTQSPSYQLNLYGIPGKSRVETQIRLGLQLVSITKDGSEARESEIGDRFQWLKLPSWAMAKEKLKIQNRRDAPATIVPAKIVFLDARVVKSTDPLEDVTICPGCVTRERKRAQRKKDSPKMGASELEKDQSNKSKLAELMPLPDEEKKILVFNCPELLEITNGEVTIPTRITCYCRHHKEKDGFRIIITLRDASNNILASTSSELVLITDDHKTTGKVTRAKGQPISSVKGLPYTPPPSSEKTRPVPLSSEALIASGGSSCKKTPSLSTSRRSSPSTAPSRKRKAETTPAIAVDSTQNKIQKVPSSLSMTNMLTQRTTRPLASASADTSRAPSPASSRHLRRSPSQDSLMLFMNDAQYLNSPVHAGVRQSISTANSASSPETNFFDNTMDELMQDRTLSASPRARTWDYIMDNSQQAEHDSLRQSYQHQSSLIMPPASRSQSYTQAPIISRMIPAEGPLQGGVEVTMLGSGFRPGMTAMFGDAPAVPTHCWSTTTLVCVLPPATNAGPVPVTFKEHPYSIGAKIFTYVDQTDRALFELALQVIGLKTTGRLETARDVAMRICASKMPSESADANFGAIPVSQLRAVLGLNEATEDDAEDLVRQCLRYSDLIENDRKVRLSLRSRSGHTMLHLATIQGYSTLVQELLDRGANANMRDRASLTPLHTAALHGRRDIAVQLLLTGYANIALCTSDGRTAYDLAEPFDDADLLDALDPWATASAWDQTASGTTTRSNSFSSYSADSEPLIGGSLIHACESEFTRDDTSGCARNTCRQPYESRTYGQETLPASRESSATRNSRQCSSSSRPRSRSITSFDASQTGGLCHDTNASSESTKALEAEVDGTEAQHIAANFLQLQQSWMAFLAETSPTWLQKTLANANASIPEVFKTPPNLSHHMQLPMSPISAFQAMLPQMPHIRSLSRNNSQGPLVQGTKPAVPDATWLQTIVASLGAPPSYAEATCASRVESSPSILGSSDSATDSTTLAQRSTASDFTLLGEARQETTNMEATSPERQKYFWQSPLRSQGRVAGLTPEQQRAQVRKLQKPTDPRLYCLWLPCLLFFMLISVGKAFLCKLSGLLL